MKDTLRVISKALKEKQLFSLYMVSDQRPSKTDLNFWTTFMHQDTPVITGMDKLARKFNLAVVFLNVRRFRRGYYTVEFKLLDAEPKKSPQYSIAEKYIRSLEELIRQQPEFYLWSHKRWKYKPEFFKPKVSE
jgi:KDO2-lipid IV(A) lauroyltransferase